MSWWEISQAGKWLNFLRGSAILKRGSWSSPWGHWGSCFWINPRVLIVLVMKGMGVKIVVDYFSCVVRSYQQRSWCSRVWRWFNCWRNPFWWWPHNPTSSDLEGWVYLIWRVRGEKLWPLVLRSWRCLVGVPSWWYWQMTFFKSYNL